MSPANAGRSPSRPFLVGARLVGGGAPCFVIAELGWLPLRDAQDKDDGVGKYAVGFWRYAGKFINFTGNGKQYALPNGQFVSELGAYHFIVTLTTSSYYSWWTIKTGS